MILVLSVPRTGTWFVVDQLKDAYPDEEVIQAHIGDKFYKDRKEKLNQLSDSNNGRLVIPLRDPLAALVTSYCVNRIEHDDIIGGFLTLSTAIEHLDNYNGFGLEFIPVEMHPARDDDNLRNSVTQDPYKYLGRTFPLRDAYVRKDLSAIINSKIQNKVTKLISLESKLRPFLEQHGYRNLIWWPDINGENKNV